MTNWRAGLFRVWIVFSAVWIVAALSYDFFLWRGSTYEVTDPSGLIFMVAGPSNIAQKDVVDFVRQSEAAKKRQADCASQSGPWCKYPQSLQMPHSLPWGWLALWLVSGPIIALALGAAIFWIGAGFRRPIKVLKT